MATKAKTVAGNANAAAPAAGNVDLDALIEAAVAKAVAARVAPAAKPAAAKAAAKVKPDEPQWLNLEPEQIVTAKLADGRQVWIRRGRKNTTVTLNDPKQWAGK